MKKAITSFIILTLLSCDFFKPQKPNDVIAIVNQHILYKEDINKVIPKNLSKNDSLIFVKSFIDQWAMDKLILDNAKYNIPEDEQERYNSMVQKYKTELFKKAYMDALIQKELKVKIDSNSIVDYYNKNKNSFKINEHLLKIRYIYANNDLKNLKKIKESFRRFEPEDINYLIDNELKFDKINLNDSVWIKSVDVFKNLKELNSIQQKSLMSSNTYVGFTDSLGMYLIYVKEVLTPNSVAPLSYIKPTIKQILTNKEKLKLKADLEKRILNDAIKDNTYEVFN